MAEVIGLISGLYTIGKAGLHLYDTLTMFAEGIRAADKDVTLVAYEIKSTSDILLLIRDSLQDGKESTSQIIKQGRLILEGLANQCEFCHDLIKDLISFLRPYFDESQFSRSRELVRHGHRIKQVKLLDKWRWQQQRPKIDKLRGYLEALKSNLGLVLPLLHYQIAEERRAPALTLQSLKDTIEVALREARSHPSNLTQELAKDAEAIRPTSMAVIVQRNRSDTPQAVAQELAENILCSDRQRRPYAGYGGESKDTNMSNEGLNDEHRRLKLPEPRGNGLRGKWQNLDEFHGTTNGGIEKQSLPPSPPPTRYHVPDDDRDQPSFPPSEAVFSPRPYPAPNLEKFTSFQMKGVSSDHGRSPIRHPHHTIDERGDSSFHHAGLIDLDEQYTVDCDRGYYSGCSRLHPAVSDDPDSLQAFADEDQQVWQHKRTPSVSRERHIFSRQRLPCWLWLAVAFCRL